MSTLTTPAPSIELTATVNETAWKEGEKPRFNATHRCDKCGAQAYVQASVPNGHLLFCLHDSREVRPKMEAKGVLTAWYSETDRLIENKTQGSEN